MSMIYTFYSYKGGVGRSMALANLAEILCQTGLDVLMIDWDLEAPGLERFFFADPSEVFERKGLIDMIEEYKTLVSTQASIEGIEETDIPFKSPTEYTLEIYPRRGAYGRLLLLPAGRRAEGSFVDYARTVLSFDWNDFYERWQGELYFEWFRDEVARLADVVLIDSRTGVTEMGGVCTYQLADIVVMLCTASEQCIQGTYQMAQNLSAPQLQTLRRGRSLDILVLPARLERAEGDLLDQFQAHYADLFQQFLPGHLNARELFLQAGIPYVPKYAFSEIVASRQSGRASAESMVMAFRMIEDILTDLRLERLARTRPRDAARQIGLMFNAMGPKDSEQLLKLVTLTQHYADYFSDTNELLIYARGVEAFIRGDRVGAANQFGKILGDSQAVRLFDLELSVPAKVLDIIRQRVWKFRNFDLRISKDQTSYNVYAGGKSTPIDLALSVHNMPDDASASLSTANISPRVFTSTPTALVAWGRQVGRLLFEATFAGPVLAEFRATLDQLPNEERLRVRLHVPDELASLPWELLFDPLNEQFLSLRGEVVFVRASTEQQIIHPVHVEAPLHVLAITASPERLTLSPDKADQNLRWLDQTLRASIERQQLALDIIAGRDILAEISPALGKQETHILHLSCRLQRADTADEVLLLFKDQDKNTETLSLDSLRTLLMQQSSMLRLICIDLDENEDAEIEWILSEMISRLIQKTMLSVVILPGALKPDTRAEFIRVLYAELAASTPLDVALTEAKLHLQNQFTGSLDWARPILFLQSEDGVIFDFKHHVKELQPARVPVSVRQPTRFARRFDKSGGYEPARIIAMSNTVSPAEYLLIDERVTVGRAPSCDIVVTNQRISRLHAEIIQEGPRCIVSDLGSANGTFVNRRRILGAHPLEDEDMIGLGSPEPLLRYTDPESTNVAYSDFAYSGLSYDSQTMIFTLNGQRLELTLMQSKLLAHLYQHAGTVCSRESCAEVIWGRDYEPGMDAGALDQALNSLRRVLRNADPDTQYIQTRRGQGYVLML